MKLIVTGDSITRGSFYDYGKNEWKVAAPNYATLLNEGLAADAFLLAGFNGISYSRTSKTNSELALSIITNDLKGADIFVIAGGTNDYGTGVELGNIADETDVSFYGALKITFSTIKRNNPNAKIFAVLPIRRLGDFNKNNTGHTLDDYRSAIAIVAKEYGINVLHGENAPINPNVFEEKEKYIPDGLHPNNAGHIVYGNFLLKEIKKSYEN